VHKENTIIQSTLLPKEGGQVGFVVSWSKKTLKRAATKCLEHMRLFARARSLNFVWGLASNLYDWQILTYDKQAEVRQAKDFYEMSKVCKLYVKEKQYSYHDEEMKLLVAVVASVL